MIPTSAREIQYRWRGNWVLFEGKPFQIEECNNWHDIRGRQGERYIEDVSADAIDWVYPKLGYRRHSSYLKYFYRTTNRGYRFGVSSNNVYAMMLGRNRGVGAGDMDLLFTQPAPPTARQLASNRAVISNDLAITRVARMTYPVLYHKENLSGYYKDKTFFIPSKMEAAAFELILLDMKTEVIDD